YLPEPVDRWQPVGGSYPGRDRTIDTRWLTFESSPRGVVPRFRDGVSDLPPDALPPLLQGGRFLFDVMNDFVWRGPANDSQVAGYWLLTPIGVVRLDRETG